MNYPQLLKKYGLPILMASALILIASDPAVIESLKSLFSSTSEVRTDPASSPFAGLKNEEKTAPGERHLHDETTEEDRPMDHSSPENQKRMGIFHYNEGNKFLKQGDIEEAIRNYKMALHHNPEFQETQVNLSTAYLHARRYDDALTTLSGLEKINPKNPYLHYNLACYYSLTGKVEPGLESLAKALELGFPDRNSVETDPDLENLRQAEGFKSMAGREGG